MGACVSSTNHVAAARAERIAQYRAEEAAVIRASLQEVNERIPHGMTEDQRLEFISNVLLSAEYDPKNHSKYTKHTCIPIDDGQTSSAPDVNTAQHSCSICLAEYEKNDQVCWSHNSKCDHFFHRECITKWLVHHDECPCCRKNFLSLQDDDDETDTIEIPHIQADDIVHKMDAAEESPALQQSEAIERSFKKNTGDIKLSSDYLEDGSTAETLSDRSNSFDGESTSSLPFALPMVEATT